MEGRKGGEGIDHVVSATVLSHNNLLQLVPRPCSCVAATGDQDHHCVGCAWDIRNVCQELMA